MAEEEKRKIYIVRTKSVHHMVYSISIPEGMGDLQTYRKELEEKINKLGPAELTQMWDGEQVESMEGPFTEAEYVAEHDALFPDLKDQFDNETKLSGVQPYEYLNEENIMLEDSELI